MVGGVVMAVAFAFIVVCSAAAAVVAVTLAVNLSAARVVLAINAVCYVLVAFAQHLFVFEDMLLELKDSNRELLSARAELHHAAITDALTGLYNRRLFDEVAAHQLEHHRRFHLPLSLVYIDIDRFKAVNDTHGHDVGDRLLRHVAGYLRSQVREADYVFRLGGDEFLILISCSAEEAQRKAHELQAGLLQTLRNAQLPDTVALSVGVTELPPGSRDIAAAVQQADARMYVDKRQRAMAAGA
jgi:diguanylate cyclase (GGDEF)-like protein